MSAERTLVRGLAPPDGRRTGRRIAAAVSRATTQSSSSIMYAGLAPRVGNSHVAFHYWALPRDESGNGRRVLLDYNLGAPDWRVRALFGHVPGIGDYLADPVLSIEDICLQVATDHYLLPAGQEVGDMNEHVLSMRFETLFAELYNYMPDAHLVVDAPPLTSGDLTYGLADLCDNVFAVVPGTGLTAPEVSCLPGGLPFAIDGAIVNDSPSR